MSADHTQEGRVDLHDPAVMVSLNGTPATPMERHLLDTIAALRAECDRPRAQTAVSA